MPPAGDPVHKGTLVCVVLKAKNLPNKRSIGKQDPYCVLAMGSKSQKTNSDKRGGQHPTWDEQLHFEVYEDMEDALVAKTLDGSISKASAASTRAGAKGGKKVLKVSCYADDNKNPEFIGEGIVDLTETLKTGEFDEWVPIKAKDRYAGEVYLELTFYSAAAPPKRVKSIKPVVSGNDTYGGAGSFQDIDDLGQSPAAPPKGLPPRVDVEVPASMRPGGGHLSSLSGSVSVSNLSSLRPSSGMAHSATMSDIPSSLRPSSSLAHIDAYTPPYAPSSIGRGSSPAPPPAHPGDVPTEFGQQHRRDSFVAPGGAVSEYGGGIVPSASYYGHSATPSQATIVPISYHAGGGSDRYGTVSSLTSTSSHSQLPTSATVSHLSSYGARPADPADQLSHSMSAMCFHQSLGGSDRPPPPPTPTPSTNANSSINATPPQSHIYYYAGSQISNVYQPPQHSYTPQPSHPHLPTPPPHPASAPPTHAEYSQGGGPAAYPYPGSVGGGVGGHEDAQRPVSPAPSTYGTATPSVINAQAYYQQQQQSQLQPSSHHLQQHPPRAPSPALSTSTSMSMPYSSPTTGAVGYSGGGEGSLPPMRRAPRPLPSTQAMAPNQNAAPVNSGPYAQPSMGYQASPSAQTWQHPHPAPPQQGGGAGESYVSQGMTHSYSQNWSTPPTTVSASVHGSTMQPSTSMSGYAAAAPPAQTSTHHVPAPPQRQEWTQGYASSYDPSQYVQPPPPPPPSAQHHNGMSHTTSYSSGLYGHYGAPPPPQQ